MTPFAQRYYLFCRLIFTLFPDTYRPGACERDVCYTSWESLRDCRCGGTGVDQSHWERGNNTHTHTPTLCCAVPVEWAGWLQLCPLSLRLGGTRWSCPSQWKLSIRERGGTWIQTMSWQSKCFSCIFFICVCLCMIEMPIQIFISSYLILMTEFEYFPYTDTKSTLPAGAMCMVTRRNKPHHYSHWKQRQTCVIIICLWS